MRRKTETEEENLRVNKSVEYAVPIKNYENYLHMD